LGWCVLEEEKSLKITNLQVNHLTTPMGITGHKLRISWNLHGGKRQRGFEVIVKDEQEKILESSHVEADAMAYILKKDIPYRTKANITVKVWDEENVESEPEIITVVTGIDKKDWKAKWINPEVGKTKGKIRRASYVKKRFVLSEKQLEEAKRRGAYLYGTCHGIMNIYVNGAEITNHQFMPGTQQYDKRLMVETIDVSSFLRAGDNEILVSLGDGWYRGTMGFSQNKNVYGKDIALLLQLEIAKTPIVITDETWTATQDGPIGRNDFMAGEEYDARKEFEVTNGLVVEAGGFHQVKVEDYGYHQLIQIDTVPMIPQETFQARQVVTPNEEVVLDFGQNIVGYVAFSYIGIEGKKLTLIHGETLDQNGNFTIDNFQNSAKPTKQQIDYICKNGRNTYHPTKTYMGFRYVKVIADFEIDPAAFTAVAVYSDMQTTASFSCGVAEVNQLFQNALWSMKGNFVDVPTDCPTREKSGYSGDCQAYVHTAMYMMDCYCVYAKWIREQASGQYEDGVVPQIAPKASKPGKKDKIGGVLVTDGGIGWSDSFEIVPYHLMKRFGDDTLIHENYEAMKKWTEHEIKRARKTRLCNYKILPKEHRKYMIDKDWMWGEWLEPGQDEVNYMKDLVIKGDPEVGTAFFYLNLKYMEQMAECLAKKEDQKYYHDLAQKAKAAYRAVYLENGVVKENKRQCRFVRPIAHDLLTEEEKVKAASDLAELISKNGNHLNTGFLTTHELCRSLSRYGQNKKAYDLLLQKEKPGWLYAVTKGCTTIPESWDCFDENGKPKNSFNHYSYGAVVGWLMDTVCGIKVSDGKITIHPYPDDRLGYASAIYDSPYGKIVSEWKYQEDKIVFHIEIPANMKAEILLFGRERTYVEAGIYQYEIIVR
jgi:alpha-L-rhamnosidase